VLLGRSRHVLTDHSDRITEIGSCDGQVYKASDDSSEPCRVADSPGIGAMFYGSVQRRRDGLTVSHPELEEHIQRIMLLADQYAFRSTDHFDPRK
jgi:hypothetical protein